MALADFSATPLSLPGIISEVNSALYSIFLMNFSNFPLNDSLSSDQDVLFECMEKIEWHIVNVYLYFSQ
jgi:hypothetical protein